MNRRRKYLHNHLAESLVTLPACLVIGLLVWAYRMWQLAESAQGAWAWSVGPLVFVLLTMYVVTETNNAFRIIRARTRLAAALVVLFLCLHPTILTEWSAILPALMLTISYPLIFRSYQQHEQPGGFFYAVFFLSLSSLFARPLLMLFPLYVFYMAIFMRCMSLRTFMAALLGLALPYALWAMGCFLLDRPIPFLFEESASNLWQETLWNQGFSTSTERAVWWCLLYYSLISLTHYWRENYTDKIRTRQFLYIYVCQTVAIHVLILLNPQNFAAYASSLAVSNAPVLTHYLTLTRTRWALLNALCCMLTFLYLFYSVVWAH